MLCSELLQVRVKSLFSGPNKYVDGPFGLREPAAMLWIKTGTDRDLFIEMRSVIARVVDRRQVFSFFSNWIAELLQ
ncbi:hypothetical protein SAMN05444007_103396 [Cribrihabitans marinus]|uniref:Uncharacterized protein n=1 Tax=Cribrihabitans marinus TaxID=1227549 RepID=A0A1H6WH14_9RHOB|nr:hypothetical protein SAMN05444007_103396 [Cribrihabitans marinus]